MLLNFENMIRSRALDYIEGRKKTRIFPFGFLLVFFLTALDLSIAPTS
jgi:hypothetical protein